MKRIEKLKIKLADLIKSGQEQTPRFDDVVSRLATALDDERLGLRLHRVDYLRRVERSGSIWVSARDEEEAQAVADEVLHSSAADEDDRVLRYEEDEDEDESFDVGDATEVDDEEEGE